MDVRIGFDHYTIAQRGFTPEATLRFARAHRFDGVQFLDAASIDGSLDAGALADFRVLAEGMGLFVEAGIPSPNPVRRSRGLGRPVPPGEVAGLLAPHIDALAALGCRHARVYIGDRHDRFRTDASWSDQLDASLEVIRELTPRLKALGVRLAIETHADLTACELLAFLERVDPAIAGVTLDTGNLAMRLDDPLAAVQRLAPFVVATHIKDIVLAFTPRGLCWQARPVGSGILPMPDLLAPLLRARRGIDAVDRAPPADLRPADLRPPMDGVLPRPPSRVARRRRPARGGVRSPIRRGLARAPRGGRGDPLVVARPRLARQLARLPPVGRADRHGVRLRSRRDGRDPLADSRGADPMSTEPSASRRIVSLDQFRGYTVAGMLLVNFLGGYQVVPAILKHHNTYCSYADTIMPQFFFAVGFAYRLTFLRRVQTVGYGLAAAAAIRRNLGLILIGFVVYHLDGKVSRWEELEASPPRNSSVGPARGSFSRRSSTSPSHHSGYYP